MTTPSQQHSRAVALARLKARRKAQRADDLRAVLSTPEGRRFIMRIMALGEVFTVGAMTDNALTLAYREGRRSIALSLLYEANEEAPEQMRLAESERRDDAMREARERAEAAE